MLFVCGNDDIRIHHIHILLNTNEKLDDYIFFRNYLNDNSSIAREYDYLKEELLIKYKDDRKKYTEAKSAFINNILHMRKR